MKPRIHRFLVVSAAFALAALACGCPHRSPLWSPDARHLLVLGGAAGEPMDKPGTRLWLVPLAAAEPGGDAKPRRLSPPGADAGLRFLAAAWVDGESFVVLTVAWADDEARSDSARVWRVSELGKTWTALSGPAPSAEHTPRRNPVIARVAGGRGAAVVYQAEDDRVVAVPLAPAGDGGGAVLELPQAVLVGPGPEGGFLAVKLNEDTGDLDILAYGGDLKPRWKRPRAELARDLAKHLGKERSAIVFNDTSTSIYYPKAEAIGVTLVFTDVTWSDGVSGYHAILRAADGAFLGGSDRVTCLPGKPVGVEEDGGSLRLWALGPSTERDVKTGSLRAYRVSTAGGAPRPASPELQEELPGIPKSSLHGYAARPDGAQVAVVINGASSRLRLYRIAGGKIAGAAREIVLE